MRLFNRIDCNCNNCPLFHCKNPYNTEIYTKSGDSPIDIMFIGENVRSDDKGGMPFSGDAGLFFRKILERLQAKNLTMAFSYLVKCQSKYSEETSKINNACLKNLIDEIDKLRPKLIVFLGSFVAKYFVKFDNIGKERGIIYNTDIKGNSYKCVITWAANYAMINNSLLPFFYQDIEFAIDIANGYELLDDWKKNGSYTILKTVPEVKDYVNHLLYETNENDFVALDVETRNLNKTAGSNKLGLLQFATDTKSGVCIPYEHPQTPFDMDELKQVKSYLYDLFTVKPKFNGWVVHGGVFEQIQIASKITSRTINNAKWYDTMSMAFCLDENRCTMSKILGSSYGLKKLAKEFLGFNGYSNEILLVRSGKAKADIIEHKEENKNSLLASGASFFEAQSKEQEEDIESKLLDLPLDELCSYGAMDVYVTLRLFWFLINKASKYKYSKKLLKMNSEYFAKAFRISSVMSRNGFYIDQERLRRLKGPQSPILVRMEELQNEMKQFESVQKANVIIERKKSNGRKALFGTPWVYDIDKKDHNAVLIYNVLGLTPLEDPPAKYLFDENDNKRTYEDAWKIAIEDGKIPPVNKELFEKYGNEYQEIANIAEYAQMKKLSTAYLNQIDEYVNPKYNHPDCKDSRVRPNFHFTRTVTARSCSDQPNTQQIPRCDTDAKREIKNVFASQEKDWFKYWLKTISNRKDYREIAEKQLSKKDTGTCLAQLDFMANECVTGDTLITTNLGNISIEELMKCNNIKDIIVSTEKGCENIAGIRYTGIKNCLKIKTKKHSITVSDNHLVAVYDNQENKIIYKRADNLKIDEDLLSRKEENKIIKNVDLTYYNLEKIVSIEPVGPRKVYDLAIENDPSFFANGLLVHNCRWWAILSQDKNLAKALIDGRNYRVTYAKSSEPYGLDDWKDLEFSKKMLSWSNDDLLEKIKDEEIKKKVEHINNRFKEDPKFHDCAKAGEIAEVAGDIHKLTASLMFQVGDVKKVEKWQRQAAKCLTGDTYVFTDKGLLTLEKLSKEKASYIASGTITGTMQDCWNTKEADNLISITTSKGYTIKGTIDHKIQVLNKDLSLSWKRLDQITKEDIVPICKHINLWPENMVKIDFDYYTQVVTSNHTSLKESKKVPKFLTPELARILGYIISEGNIKEGNINVCNTDKQFIDDFKKCYFDCFGELDNSIVIEDYDPGMNYLPGTSFNIRKYVTQFLFKAGLKRALSGDHEVPETILRSPKIVVANFLKAYFEGDGTITIFSTRNQDKIKVTSKSKKLLQQIQILLLNFGIVSKLYYEYRITPRSKEKRIYWNLVITGEYYKIFQEEIGFISNRKHVLGTRNYYGDIIPYAKENIQKGKGFYFGEWTRAKNLTYKYIKKNEIYIFSNKLKNLNENLYNNLKFIVDNNYFFDSISNIESIKEKTLVYDVTVPENHQFVANGIIAHNCIVFGWLYGRSTASIATQLKNPNIDEVQALCDQFGNQFPQGRQWLNDIEKFGEEHLYVETPTGFRRHLYSFLYSGFNQYKGAVKEAKRFARNSPIQCIASQAAAIGISFLLDYIENNGLPWLIENAVHDSCVVQIPACDIEEFCYTANELFTTRLMNFMADTWKINFIAPLEVEFEISQNPIHAYGHMEKWDFSRPCIKYLTHNAM